MIIAVIILLWLTGCLVFIAYELITGMLWHAGYDLRPYIDNAPYEVKSKEEDAAREKWRRENPVEAAKEDREFENYYMLMERRQRECASNCLRQRLDSFDSCYEFECK